MSIVRINKAQPKKKAIVNKKITEKKAQKDVNYYTTEIFKDSLNPQRYIDRAYEFLRLKLYAQAIQDCEQALEIEENSINAYLAKAEILVHIYKFNAANLILTKIIILNSEQATAYYMRYWVHLALNMQPEAAKDLAKAEQIKPEILNFGQPIWFSNFNKDANNLGEEKNKDY